jgi:hypothetical protein
MGQDEIKESNFIFTWKPDHWPYEKLRALVDDFEAGKEVIENWRCSAIHKIHPGAKAYLLRQGKPKGIFAVAVVTGKPLKRINPKPGESDYEVPLRFEILLDPTKRFLVSEEGLLKLPTPPHRWNTNRSGHVSLEREAAKIIDGIAAKEAPNKPPEPHRADAPTPTKQERLLEVYQRDQSLVEELKVLYQGHCQICDSVPFSGAFGSLVEGHHIKWLCRGGADALDNMVLLCPNHHAAIHSGDPDFDWIKFAFKFRVKELPIRLDRHLKKA